MSNIRNVIWTAKGYIPEGFDWKNYVPVKDTALLRHDLYHHQLGELGNESEELRTFGAAIYFAQPVPYRPIRYVFEDNFIRNEEGLVKHLKLLIKYQPLDTLAYEHNTKVYYGLLSKTKTVKKIHRIVSMLNDTTYSEYFLYTLNEGYEHAKQFSRKAYNKFGRLNISKYYSSLSNLKVDLTKGEVELYKLN